MKKVKRISKTSLNNFRSHYHKFFLIMFLCFGLSSCSYFARSKSKHGMFDSSGASLELELTDKSGKFNFLRELGYSQNKSELIVKQQIFAKDEEGKLLEKNITISTLGKIKGMSILRPKISQYTVWLSKQRYFTEMKISPKSRSMQIKMVSPEEQWSGETSVKFPKMSGVFCYFSQIIECANYTGFLDKASEHQTGSMKMLIIWEGYPYFQEQYLNVPNEVFSEAVFEYDGKNRNLERRFTLKFKGQSIFYFVDNKNRFKKMFWVSQGLSLVPRQK